MGWNVTERHSTSRYAASRAHAVPTEARISARPCRGTMDRCPGDRASAPLRLVPDAGAVLHEHAASLPRTVARHPTAAAVPRATTTATASRCSSPTRKARASPISTLTTAATPALRTASAKPRTAACPTSRSAAFTTTRCGYGSFSSPKTSSHGPSSSASQTKPARGSSRDCATGCCTSQGGSPATPAARSCGSHATGPGQGSSPPHSHACKRSQPRQADRGAAGAATDGHSWDTRASACPQTAHRPPTERARTAGATVNTPIATRHAPTHPISTARRAPRDRYCKRRDSAPAARSRPVATRCSATTRSTAAPG